MFFLRLAENRGSALTGRLAGAALTVCVAAACGTPQEAGRGAAPEQANFSAEDVSFGASLAQMRGHHLVSLELYRSGDAEAALVHASHPVEELYTAVRGELDAHGAGGLSESLLRALEAGATAIERGAPAARVQSLYDRARGLSERAQRAVVGPAGELVSYQASVVAALLSTAAHEYDEAVGRNGIRLLAEYQDGYAFVREARRLYTPIAPQVRAASRHEAQEVEEAFEVLLGSLPAPAPPRSPAPLDDVEVAAELIGHELEETVGARIATTVTPEEVGAEINELLTEVVRAYEEGNADEAAELSAEAYLENYELIEPDVIEQAPDVNARLEPLLGAELRRRIQEGAPTAEVRSLVGRARGLLADALRALEGGEEGS